MINVLFLDLFGVLIGADSSSIIKYVVNVCQIKTKSAYDLLILLNLQITLTSGQYLGLKFNFT